MEIEGFSIEDDHYETNMKGFFVYNAISKNSAVEAIIKALDNYTNVPANAIVAWYEAMGETAYRVCWLENKMPIALKGDDWKYLKDFCLYTPTHGSTSKAAP